MGTLFFDSETTTKNKGHVFTPENIMVSYSYDAGNGVNFKYYTDPDFKPFLLHLFDSANELIGFNIKFDIHWAVRNGVPSPLKCKVWDIQLAEFVLSGQTARFISLNEVLTSYGMSPKVDKVKEYWDAGIDTINIPVHILEEYGNYDVACLPDIVKIQKQLMTPKQIALVYILGEDLKTLQNAEYNGIKFDTTKANEKLRTLSESLATIESHLNNYLGDIPEHFDFNWDSGDHLSALLYGGTIVYDYAVPTDMVYKSGPRKGTPYVQNKWFTGEVSFPAKFKPLPNTEVKKTKDDPKATTRFYQTDEPTLKQLKTRVVADRKLLELIQERSGIIKIVEMIRSIIKKAEDMGWDNYIHAQYNQNVAITGRLSSSNPNMQNTPAQVDELLVSRYD